VDPEPAVLNRAADLITGTIRANPVTAIILGVLMYAVTGLAIGWALS
jgi:hypothetical protein